MRTTVKVLARIAMTAGFVVLLTTFGAGADPGQPLGDDDAGCVPDTKDHLHCADTIAKALAKLAGPRNATLYCDGALPTDPNGDDLGTIDPTSKDHLRCAGAAAKSLAK